MHISKIVIQGFKTFRDLTVIDDISPHDNVIVGRNGSGKSNFFAAIRFVLSDAYTNMSLLGQQALIHEGTETIMSAFVEIHFNNSDGRFPLNKSDLSIRRTIGSTRDDYAIDGKPATQSDILNLLESAGFSRSNPYYIVPQGRVTSLTNSSDEDRLALLKQVSGALVFENKMKESIKEMDHSNYKKQRIDETLFSIDERLIDLRLEADELEEFHGLERVKKILQYKLLDRELVKLQEQIEIIQEKHSEELNRQQADLQNLELREKLCVDLSHTINGLKTSLKVLILEKEQMSLELSAALAVVSQNESQRDDLVSKVREIEARIDSTNREIEECESEIRRYKNLAGAINPKIDELKELEARNQQTLAELIESQRALYAKQDRLLRFKNKQQRDIWLGQQLSLAKSQLAEKETDLAQYLSQQNDRDKRLALVTDRIQEIEVQLASQADEGTALGLKSTISDLKSTISTLMDTRKTLWREEIKLKGSFDSINNDLNRATEAVNKSMDRAQAQGIRAVFDSAERLGVSNEVYGTVADLFSINDKYKTAAEVVAGNSLFNVVVDTDKTASLIMNELVRNKTGRVTFMPLNRLKTSLITYPDSNEYQCVPLLKKIKIADARAERAIRFVFGRAVVCADLRTGADMSREFKLTAITLDGDRVDTQGIVSGGYRDHKSSRLDSLKMQTRKKQELRSISQKVQENAANIERVTNEMTVANNELQLSLRDLDASMSERGPVKAKLEGLLNEKYEIERDLDTIKLNILSAQNSKQRLVGTIQQLKSELDSDFISSLTPEDHKNLEELNSQIKELEQQMDRTASELADLESQVSTYETPVANILEPRLARLLLQERTISVAAYTMDIADLEREIGKAKRELASLEERHQETSQRLADAHSEIEVSETLLETQNDLQRELVKKIQDASRGIDMIVNKKTIMTARRDDIQNSINNIGMLPEEAFASSEYDTKTSDELMHELNRVDNSIQSLSHINKKALEQYQMFTSQREEMTSRRQDLETGQKSIERLMETLKALKDAAIRKSFVLIAHSFTEIFEKLVPSGFGQLIISTETESGISGLTDSQQQTTGTENYIGVSIKVSFNSKHDEQQHIEQLSGGQKSLCAIALVLAIQRCDPAPFYLFDEIDANLDTQYRTAVAAMIHSLSRDAQFICTTFRPELVQVADKFYGITYANKVSNVSEINREDALSFVEGQAHS